MTKPDAEKLWDAFVQEVRKDAFADDLARGREMPELGNFLGSVAAHKKLFMQAIKQLEQE